MSELDLSSPPALASGLVATVVSGAVALDLATCNQAGTATFSWLLQFDTVAQTLKTGGARPVTDPTQGFSFDTETLGGFAVAPITYPGIAPSGSGAFAVTTGMDLNMPIFLDSSGSSYVLLPLHQARITMGTLTSNNDCIGSYNASGLQAASNCLPGSGTPGFIDGGSLDAYMTLEETDQVIVSAINQSLCVVLSGDASMYGMTNSSGVTVCKRFGVDAGAEAGQIIFQGNWCAATNSAATSTCADSEQAKGNFAAASVKILN
jgi:hypothetical protein